MDTTENAISQTGLSRQSISDAKVQRLLLHSYLWVSFKRRKERQKMLLKYNYNTMNCGWEDNQAHKHNWFKKSWSMGRRKLQTMVEYGYSYHAWCFSVIFDSHISLVTHSYCNPHLRDLETQSQRVNDWLQVLNLNFGSLIQNFFFLPPHPNYTNESGGWVMANATCNMKLSAKQSCVRVCHKLHNIQTSRLNSSVVPEAYLSYFLIYFIWVSCARCFLFVFFSF